jgi:hypothetical protein
MWGFVVRSHFSMPLLRGAACTALLLIGSVAGFEEQPVTWSATALSGPAKSQKPPAKIFASVLPENQKQNASACFTPQ